MKHTIAILVENEAGALARITGLFAQRNYNIESLTVAPTQDQTLSRITIVSVGSDRAIEQICKQLHKLLSVFKVVELAETPHIERELLLLKVRATGAMRGEIKRVTDIFGAQIVDVTPTTYIIQFTAKSRAIDSLIRAIGETQLIELTRSGVVGIARGEKAVNPA